MTEEKYGTIKQKANFKLEEKCKRWRVAVRLRLRPPTQAKQKITIVKALKRKKNRVMD
jgi:hypothetical protein